MVRICQVCKISKHSNPDVSFYRFPLDAHRRKEWLTILDLAEGKYMPQTACVCENHFLKEDFFKKNNGVKILKRGVNPIAQIYPRAINLPGPSVDRKITEESDSTIDETPPKNLNLLKHAAMTSTSSDTSDKDPGINYFVENLDTVTKCKEAIQLHTSFGVDFLNWAMSIQWCHFKQCQQGRLTMSQENTIIGYVSYLTVRCDSCSFIKERLLPMDTIEYNTQDSSVIPETYGKVTPLVHMEQTETNRNAMLIESSSTTLTASETEDQLGQIVSNPRKRKNIPSDTVGPGSGFRGKLSLISIPSKRKRGYIGDLSSGDFSTPTKAKRNFKKMKTSIDKQRSQIKTLQTTVKRLRLKTNSLNDLLKLLREKSYITELSENAIRASLSGPSKALLERMLKGPTKQKYDPLVRSFALTLCFYSPRAYSYVRNTFNRTLPHPSTISKWFITVDGSPGFTKEALTALKLKSADAASRGKTIVCNLVFDEMSIRKQVEWTGSKFTGYVDIGTKIKGDVLAEAKEALVFLLVPLNDSWKIPVGYFLLDGLPGAEKSELLKKCLQFVHETGVTVTSVTFDGAPANFTMAKKLGADFSNPLNLKTFFSHPVTNEKVFLFLDPCHMLKLIRNCFGFLKDFKYKENLIQWKFLAKLVDLQNIEGLQAATKIKTRHLQRAREKMKVKLAAQTLSKSVADALIYLGSDLKHSDFIDVEPTADFVQTFNDLFDIFNCRNRFAKYLFKRPLSPITAETFFPFFDQMTDYICNLSINDLSVLDCPRKTGFLGFLICIKSLKALYQTYVQDKQMLKYILTYKLSQDHLELFFGAIGSKGGYNNNPTARQFEAAYKRLIVRSEISGPNSGNTINLENIPILSYGSGTITLNENEDLEQTQKYISFQQSIRNDISQNMLHSTVWNLTDFTEDIVAYISGFLVKSLRQCITCPKCMSLLECEETFSQLQIRKQYGALVRASKFVIDICTAGEKYFRFFHKTKNIFNSQVKNILIVLITNSYKLLPVSVYEYFGDHLYEDDPIDGHASNLIKLILKTYFNIRIHHETTKIHTKEIRVRSLLNKTILFKGQ